MRKFVAICKKVDEGRLDPWNPDREKKKLTLGQATDKFLETKQHLRPKTQKAYELSMKALKKHAPPNLMVAHLQSDHVKAFVHAPGEWSRGKDKPPEIKPVSAATKRHRLRHVKVFVRWCQNEGYLHTNPLEGVKLPKAGKRKPEFMTPAQLECVLNAIEAHVDMKKPGGHIRDGEVLWLKDVILFTVGTGMRRGEVCSLRWRDVDFDSGFVCIRNSESFQTKSGDDRWIPLVGDAMEALLRRHEARQDDLEGPVFTYGDGRPVMASYVSKRFKKFVRMAKVDERLKFHSLRHTTASWLTMKGVSPVIIQQILGHADISTTMIYAHLAPDAIKSAFR